MSFQSLNFELSNNKGVKCSAKITKMNVTIKKDESSLFDDLNELMGTSNYYYSFEHDKKICLTKEEKEEMGKRDGRIDGIYKGRINMALVESGEKKIQKQFQIEKEYEEKNPIEIAVKKMTSNG